jgi:hypothetical protein
MSFTEWSTQAFLNSRNRCLIHNAHLGKKFLQNFGSKKTNLEQIFDQNFCHCNSGLALKIKTSTLLHRIVCIS